MNFKKYLLFMALQFFVLHTFAQSQTMILSYEDFIQLRQMEAPVKGFLQTSDIAGSPYLSKNFRNGSVWTKQKVKYINIPLRYNAFSDAIEFENAKGEPMEIKFPESIKEVKIGDTVWVYRPYRVDKKVRKGYFQLLNRGKAEGLVRYRIEFQKAQPAGAYKGPQPPAFVSLPPSLYVGIDGRPAVEVHNTKTLIRLLGNHQKALQMFAKKENIKIRRAKDLKQILEYYNRLEE